MSGKVGSKFGWNVNIRFSIFLYPPKKANIKLRAYSYDLRLKVFGALKW